jgi:hypothetical protein
MQTVHLFDIFVKEHLTALEHTYEHILSNYHRERISFDDWCNFAFTNSSKPLRVYHGLRLLQ